MRILSALTLGLGMAIAAPSYAQSQTGQPASPQAAPAAPRLTVGAKVYDPKGGEVGTIESMIGE